MDWLHLGQSAFLGVVEGLTEFLPVSSTGHLILFDDLLNITGQVSRLFDIVIQLGAILAICWIYRQKFTQVIVRLPYDKQAQAFTRNVLLAFLPAMVIGVFAYKTIKDVLMTPVVVSWALIAGGIAILIIERVVKKVRFTVIEEFPVPLSLKIGFFQCLAMVPGVSRSGATIMGALLVGVDRKTAAEFSFFLAVPTMFGATVYDLYKHHDMLSSHDILGIAVGFIMAFLSALVVVRLFIGFISRNGFAPFAWYRIILGTIMLGLIYLK